MDFTLSTYKELLQTLKTQGYTFVTFHDFLQQNTLTQNVYPVLVEGQIPGTQNPEPRIQNPKLGTRNPCTERSRSGPPTTGHRPPATDHRPPTTDHRPPTTGHRPPTTDHRPPTTGHRPPITEPQPTLVLRHDVDLKPQNSLHFAQVQHEMGIRGTYYFRIVPQSFHPHILEQIASLGHEIGYHYEDIDLVPNKARLSEEQMAEQAIELFEKHLAMLRQHYPVSTICMHGSPMSKYDNKLVWKHYSYRDYGIIAEPYFDVDYNKVFYITDTGRRWDGGSVSIRDKVQSSAKWPTFRHTRHIIDAVNGGAFPHQSILNFHPQRWTNSPLPWAKELVWQSIKNIVKAIIVKRRA